MDSRSDDRHLRQVFKLEMLKQISIKLIQYYQRKGGSKALFSLECNFEPTCSEYTKQAIIRFGVFQGWRLGILRIKKCTDRDCVSKILDPIPER